MGTLVINLAKRYVSWSSHTRAASRARTSADATPTPRRRVADADDDRSGISRDGAGDGYGETPDVVLRRPRVDVLLDAPRLLPALTVAQRVAKGVEAEAGREWVVTQRRRQPIAELVQVLSQVLRQDGVLHTLGEARRDGLAEEASGRADVPTGQVTLVLPVASPE